MFFLQKGKKSEERSKKRPRDSSEETTSSRRPRKSSMSSTDDRKESKTKESKTKTGFDKGLKAEKIIGK